MSQQSQHSTKKPSKGITCGSPKRWEDIRISSGVTSLDASGQALLMPTLEAQFEAQRHDGSWVLIQVPVWLSGLFLVHYLLKHSSVFFQIHDEMHVMWVLESLECFASLIWFDIISYQLWLGMTASCASCGVLAKTLLAVGLLIQLRLETQLPRNWDGTWKMIPSKRKIIWWNLHFWVPS